jgi:glutamate racemase
VITPASQLAADVTTSGRVGVIGTAATIESQAYKKEIHRINPRIRVIQAVCPLFVPLVEAGWLDNPITESIVQKYLRPFINSNVDTLILGCTHYPLLHRVIKRVVGRKVALIDSAPSTSKRLKEVLERRGIIASRSKQKGKLKVYVSDLPRNFLGIGERFLGHKIDRIETVPI